MLSDSRWLLQTARPELTLVEKDHNGIALEGFIDSMQDEEVDNVMNDYINQQSM